MNITPEKLRQYVADNEDTIKGSVRLMLLSAAGTIESLQNQVKAVVIDFEDFMNLDTTEMCDYCRKYDDGCTNKSIGECIFAYGKSSRRAEEK